MTAASPLPLRSGLRALRVLPQAVSLIREGAGRDFALGAAAQIGSGLVPALMGLAARVLVDALASGAGWSPTVMRLIALQLALAALGLALQYSADYFRTAMRERLGRHLTLRMAEHAAGLDLAFFEQPGNYDTFAQARQDLGFRPMMMAYSLLFSLQQGATVAGFFLAVLAFQPLLALALALAALPTLFAAGKSGSESWSNYDFNTPQGRRAAYLESLLVTDQAAKEVRLYGLAPGFLAGLRDHTGRLVGEQLRVERRRHLRYGWSGGLGVGVEYGALAFVVWRVATGAASLGDFTLMVTALAGVRGGLTRMLAELGGLYENSLFFSALTNFLAQRPALVAPGRPAALPGPGTPLTLRLEGVTFAYPGAEKPVFQNLTLELRAGETTALVGVNGAVKTTLVKLLTRLYDPQAGRVTLNGVDLRDFDPAAYRERLGVVLQDFARYQLSARENVALGRAAQADDARLRDAARKSSALELIEGLPEGWDTLLGRQFHVRGQDLSGGQWQRVALARALYRDAPVLLLDEPTAALDAETEAELFGKYRDLTRGKITLLITHRFNTVKMADRIVVIERGEVIEDGPHAALLSRGGRYAEMYTLQAAGYADAARG